MTRKEKILDRQRRVFRIAQDATRYGLTLKMIATDADLSIDSLRNYARGETEMPLSAMDGLIGVLPTELVSLLLPEGHVIVRVPDDIDIDDFCEVASDIVNDRIKAGHPLSECGAAVGPGERDQILRKVARLRAVA